MAGIAKEDILDKRQEQANAKTRMMIEVQRQDQGFDQEELSYDVTASIPGYSNPPRVIDIFQRGTVNYYTIKYMYNKILNYDKKNTKKL